MIFFPSQGRLVFYLFLFLNVKVIVLCQGRLFLSVKVASRPYKSRVPGFWGWGLHACTGESNSTLDAQINYPCITEMRTRRFITMHGCVFLLYIGWEELLYIEIYTIIYEFSYGSENDSV